MNQHDRIPNREHNLSPRARNILGALISIIIPRNEKLDLPLEADMLDFVDRYMDNFPRIIRILFPLGLYLLEYGTWLFAFTWRPFTKMSLEGRDRYVAGWTDSRLFFKREMIKGIKGLAMMAYYSDPRITERIGYFHDEWIETTKKRRIESYEEDIRKKEADCIGLGSKERTGSDAVLRTSAGERTTSATEIRKERCDAVVIGSGAGGAVAAAELAEAGWDVVIIEEGGHYTSKDFTTDPREMIPKLYRDGGTAMIWGKPNIYFSEGRCVGGSTVLYGGMCWRTPEKILNRWQKMGIDDISAEKMEPYFERVEQRINVGQQDPESLGRANELFRDGCEKLGFSITPNPRSQIHCAGSNNCILGCPSDSKQSTLVSYIPRAQNFGASLIPCVRVDRIIFKGDRAVGIKGHFTGQSDNPGSKIEVYADVVIVAGGAAQTPALLMRSKVKHSQLGRNLLCHPNVKILGVFNEDVSHYKGVCQSHQCHEFFEQGLIFAIAGVPPGLLAMSLPHYGKASADILVEYNNMVVGGALIEDTGTGRVSAGLGSQPILQYKINDRDRRTAVRGASLLSQVLLAAGAKKVYLPFHGAAPITDMKEARAVEEMPIPAKHMELFTVHIMGTARMGPDPRQHVCDNYGEVYGHPGLFIVDASALPGPVGVNPAETIMALSTRFSQRLADRREEFIEPKT